MQRVVVAMVAGVLFSWTALAEQSPWIEKSNSYARQLLDVQLQHSPERGSREGAAKYDELVSNPTLADQLAERHDLAHEVPFHNASSVVFQGLRALLDDQVAPERRRAALVRLRKYAGVEPGSSAITEIFKQRELEQIAKPGVIYPSKGELETELGRNSSYVEGIPALFKKYQLTGWEPAFSRLKDQLSAYDKWVREALLPKARTDFRLPPQAYALAFEGYGIGQQLLLRLHPPVVLT